jgi:hypothetical protein
MWFEVLASLFDKQLCESRQCGKARRDLHVISGSQKRVSLFVRVFSLMTEFCRGLGGGANKARLLLHTCMMSFHEHALASACVNAMFFPAVHMLDVRLWLKRTGLLLLHMCLMSCYDHVFPTCARTWCYAMNISLVAAHVLDVLLNRQKKMTETLEALILRSWVKIVWIQVNIAHI